MVPQCYSESTVRSVVYRGVCFHLSIKESAIVLHKVENTF